MRPIQRIDSAILKRILYILYYEVDLNRSQLARKSALNWTQMEKYLLFLCEIELVILDVSKFVKITQRGRKYVLKHFERPSVVTTQNT